MMSGFLLFLFAVILVPSSLLGAYTTLLYLGIKKLPERIAPAIPPLLTILLPAIIDFLTRDVGDVGVELLPVLGYFALSLVVTAMAAAPLVPLMLIKKFKKIDRVELIVFAASTISFAFVLLQGFAEVMGAGRAADVGISTLSEIYIRCLEIAGISFIAYLVLISTDNSEGGAS